jgi:hypothetical protein
MNNPAKNFESEYGLPFVHNLHKVWGEIKKKLLEARAMFGVQNK